MEDERKTDRRIRNMTDEDLDKLAELVVSKGEKALWNRFMENLGRGLWGFIWKGLIMGLLVLAAYGAGKKW